jgi:hypothetical protein
LKYSSLFLYDKTSLPVIWLTDFSFRETLIICVELVTTLRHFANVATIWSSRIIIWFTWSGSPDNCPDQDSIENNISFILYILTQYGVNIDIISWSYINRLIGSVSHCQNIQTLPESCWMIAEICMSSIWSIPVYFYTTKPHFRSFGSQILASGKRW